MVTRTFSEWLRSFFGFARPSPAAAEDLSVASVREIPKAPSPTAWTDDDRLPASALQRVKKIDVLLTDLEQEAETRCLFEERLEIGRLKTTHLPRLLQSYVDIPPDHRAEVFRETGHSASFLLNERLDKILGRLQELSRQLARGNLDAFAENIRFVDSQYSPSSSPFD